MVQGAASAAFDLDHVSDRAGFGLEKQRPAMSTAYVLHLLMSSDSATP